MNVNKADKWFSLFIRLRDSNDNGIATCCTCGKMTSFKKLDCGHYVKRQHMGVRYNEKNCHAQCRECNWLKQGNDVKYHAFIIEKYGQQTHDLLKSAERGSSKHTDFELSLLAKEYEKKTKDLAKLKGIEI
jgi:hypothetical protein